MADTLILNNLLSATKKMLGNGQAWLVNAFNIKEVLKSFLIIPEVARDYFIAIADTPFPAKQFGLIPDANLEQSIEQWEKQFNIIPAETATLEERSLAVEAAWSATGSLGRGYLEVILQKIISGIYVRENIPAVDYTSEITGGAQYGQRQYGEELLLPPGAKIQYGGGGKTILLGNGFLVQDGQKKEVVNAPVNSFQWQQVFIIEGINPGDRISITEPELNYLIIFILRYKPMQSVAMLRVDVL